MFKKMCTVVVMMFLFVSPEVMAGQQPGVTSTVFNRRFIPNIRPQMPYEQIVRMTGVQGAKLGESKTGSASVSSYRWNGGKGSSLSVRIAGGRLVDATMKAPNGHTYVVSRNGKVSDMGD